MFKCGSVIYQTGVFSETALIATVIYMRSNLRGLKLVRVEAHPVFSKPTLSLERSVNLPGFKFDQTMRSL